MRVCANSVTVLIALWASTAWAQTQQPVARPEAAGYPIWVQCVKDYEPKSADEAEIVRIENELCDAAIKRDASRLSDIFADDLIWTENDQFTDKVGVMRRYMVDQQELLIELRDVKIRIEGDIAVVISHVHVVKKVGGKTIENTHTDDVFRKRGGKWQLIVA